MNIEANLNQFVLIITFEFRVTFSTLFL